MLPTDNDRIAQLDRLVLAYRTALDSDGATNYVGKAGGSPMLLHSDLWREGERQFVELERCLGKATDEMPVRTQHFKACYGLDPFQLPSCRRSIKRRGPRVLSGLGPHDRIVASPIPDSWNRTGKAVTVTIDVTVETWPAWVRREKVRSVLALIAGEFLRGEKRSEIMVPTSFFQRDAA